MQVHVPLAYVEKYLPPRCRNHREVALLGSVPVEVPETFDHFAPVALRVTVPGGWSDDEPVTTEYRWWGGRLWAKRDRVDASGLAGVLEVRSPYSWKTDGAVPRAEWCASAPANTRLETKGFEDAAAKACEAATRLLLVDGEAWCAADEPYLTIHSYTFGSRHYFQVRSADPDKADQGRWSADDWRIDEADKALDALRARGEDAPEIGGSAKPKVEVLVPEALRLRPQELALAQARERVEEAVWDACRYNAFGRFGEGVKRSETAAVLRGLLAKIEAGEEL